MSSVASILSEVNATQDTFDPAHIRPSGVGGCLREQWYRILSAVHPADARFVPTRPKGKESIAGMAQLGHIIEDSLAGMWSSGYHGKTYRQIGLTRPGLSNLDGSTVTAHPDIWVPSLNTDIEVKSVSVAARWRLPIKSHVDQLLLRLHWWVEHKKRVVVGEIPYFFRETFFDPDTGTTPVYRFVPEDGGYRCENTGEFYSRDYLVSLDDRLLSLRRSLDTLSPPPRAAATHKEFPCRLITPLFSTECPWRETCWATEIAREREPGVIIEHAGELLIKLSAAKERQAAADKIANSAKDEVKSLQKELDPIFSQFGDKVTAGGLTATRAGVNIPEKTMPGYSYFRYSVKAAKSHTKE